MENRTFIATPKSLTSALLLGHLCNIVVGFVVFAVIHWVFMLPTEQAVLATVVATAAVSVIVSRFATYKLSARFSELNQQMRQMSQEATSSATELEKAAQDSSALLENIPIGFLVFDQKTQLKTGNQRAMQLFSAGEKAANTEDILERIKHLKSNGSDINFIDWLHEVRANKIQAMKQWPFVLFENGKQATACDLIAYYSKDDSHGNDLVLLFVDKTEQYEHSERQMEFIALAAHELRGPITIMRGLVDILEDELGQKLSEDHKQLITRIIVSSRQLAGYVDNILGVSRIDKDGFDVKLREANWAQIVAQSTQDLAIRAKAHHRNLTITVPGDLPAVAVDPSAISHVINNLVDNAIKYSKEGGEIMLSANLKEDGVIETTVQDFGIGIPTNVVGNLFTRFYRSHRSKQAVNGTGLGLYLCKTIVEAHGGTIWVRSSEGSGTTFGFTLPTYAAVADQIKSGNNEEGIVRGSHGWIKNHALYRH